MLRKKWREELKGGYTSRHSRAGTRGGMSESIQRGSRKTCYRSTEKWKQNREADRDAIPETILERKRKGGYKVEKK